MPRNESGSITLISSGAEISEILGASILTKVEGLPEGSIAILKTPDGTEHFLFEIIEQKIGKKKKRWGFRLS